MNLLVLLQESGLARILLPDLGLETVMRINRPAKPGDDLDICVSFIDVPKGIYKFTEASSGQVTSSQSVDSTDMSSDEDDEDFEEDEVDSKVDFETQVAEQPAQ